MGDRFPPTETLFQFPRFKMDTDAFAFARSLVPSEPQKQAHLHQHAAADQYEGRNPHGENGEVHHQSPVQQNANTWSRACGRSCSLSPVQLHEQSSPKRVWQGFLRAGTTAINLPIGSGSKSPKMFSRSSRFERLE